MEQQEIKPLVIGINELLNVWPTIYQIYDTGYIVDADLVISDEDVRLLKVFYDETKTKLNWVDYYKLIKDESIDNKLHPLHMALLLKQKLN